MDGLVCVLALNWSRNFRNQFASGFSNWMRCEGSVAAGWKTEAKRMERMLEITSRSGAAAVTSSKHLLQSNAICSICFCIVFLLFLFCLVWFGSVWFGFFLLGGLKPVALFFCFLLLSTRFIIIISLPFL